ncbi:MAG: patatin-like phospholipase family protein [Pseudomonadota bacterium]|nr:patatin-like phospholipase family protein [Pseudomonadota bacterium]
MLASLAIVGILISGLIGRDQMLKKDNEPLRVSSIQTSANKKDYHTKSEHKRYRILVLDGGGIKGLMQLELLRYLELKNQKPIAEQFDGFICSSVGCALSGMLLTTHHHQYPTIDEIARMMTTKSVLKQIFNQSRFRMLATMNGFFGPKYSGRSKAHFLREYFDQLRYNQLAKPLMMISWSPELVEPVLLTNWTQHGYEHWPVWMIIQGVTSPPVFFPPTHIIDHNLKGYTYELDLNDGGLFLNNPILPTIIEIMVNEFSGQKPVLIVNIGTGIAKDPYTYNKIKNWGGYHWLSPLMNSMGTLAGIMAVDQIKSFVKDRKKYERLYLFNTEMTASEIKLDNITQRNVNNLEQRGRDLVLDNLEALDQLAKELLE